MLENICLGTYYAVKCAIVQYIVLHLVYVVLIEGFLYLLIRMPNDD